MFLQERVKKIQNTLPEIGCQAFLVEDPIDLYYFTGVDISTGRLLIDQQKVHLFVDARYYELCKQRCPFSVILVTPANKAFQEFFKSHAAFVKTCGFSSDVTSYKSYLALQTSLEEANHVAIKPIDGLVKRLRMIKDPTEIQLLREAGELGSKGFDFICDLLKEGITEAEVAMELEIFWKRRGSKGLGFDPIIGFGVNSSMPHYRAGDVKLKKGDPVLIDIGVNYKHYHSDMTRVLFFGSPPAEMLKIYEIVKAAQLKALALCQPGTMIEDLDKVARESITNAGYGEFFTHGLGHGVGLEIHEMPTVRNTAPDNRLALEPGMVITIEPGIYLPGIGGVRIEDTVVITAKGHENLTNRSKEVFIIK